MPCYENKIIAVGLDVTWKLQGGFTAPCADACGATQMAAPVENKCGLGKLLHVSSCCGARVQTQTLELKLRYKRSPSKSRDCISIEELAEFQGTKQIHLEMFHYV
ncbi:hypothetical protein O6H91_08G117800 [Diphasiastrum complanatum]|uniref:Uncharacterized protein n=1 Tax=Diphasiastrum complanatum TaxID=34168 RepID=A0ACC2D1L6_DIPCM|nr:hypothetical protein O6H91_08G117800 [Diphasiastrum complanatum]